MYVKIPLRENDREDFGLCANMLRDEKLTCLHSCAHFNAGALASTTLSSMSYESTVGLFKVIFKRPNIEASYESTVGLFKVIFKRPNIEAYISLLFNKLFAHIPHTSI